MIVNPSETPHDGTLQGLVADLTPLLDILFILIVFFLLTAGAVFHSMELELPKSVSETLALETSPKNITLEIHKNYYRIDGRHIPTFESLQSGIQEAATNKPEHKIIIASDKKASVDQLMRVLTYLQSTDIDTANILMLKDPTAP